jgi:hypothetical protein
MRVIAAQGPVRLSLRSVEQGRTEIASLTVAVSQPASAASVWQLRIEARFDVQGVVRELGRLDTSPPIWGVAPTKIVAIATVPGAVDWFVQVERSYVDRSGGTILPEDDLLDVELSANQDCGEPGLFVPQGSAQAVGARYRYQGGTLPAGASQVLIDAGSSVQTVQCYQVGTGGRVRIGLGAIVPLPPDGAVQLGPQGTLLGPAVVSFSNIPVGGGGYLIETLA